MKVSGTIKRHENLFKKITQNLKKSQKLWSQNLQKTQEKGEIVSFHLCTAVEKSTVILILARY